MENSVVIAGFGGQGVILAGKILAQAGMDHGLEVTWLPSYGPEMRGGTANCTVILSNETVGSPIVDNPTGLIAMNLPSLDKFEKTIAKDGMVIVNTSLIPRKIEREDLSSYYLALNEMSTKVGSAKSINMIALGAYIKVTDIIPLTTIKSTMKRMLAESNKSKFIPGNEKALDEGYNAI